MGFHWNVVLVRLVIFLSLLKFQAALLLPVQTASLAPALPKILQATNFLE